MTEENRKEKVQELIKQLKAEKVEDRQEAACAPDAGGRGQRQSRLRELLGRL